MYDDRLDVVEREIGPGLTLREQAAESKAVGVCTSVRECANFVSGTRSRGRAPGRSANLKY